MKAHHARGPIVATLAIACGGTPGARPSPVGGAPPGPTYPDAGPAAPTDGVEGSPRGVLALVPAPAGAQLPGWEWLPARSPDLPDDVVVSEPDPAGLGAPATATAIGLGGAFAASPAGEATIRYGCDGATHRFVRWRTQPAIGAGIVWLRRPGPDADASRAVAVESSATQRQRRARIQVEPPVEVTLLATAARQARLEVRRGPTLALTRDVERAVMDGDRPGALDLRERVPGLPTLLAAFTTEQAGQVLLVFGTPGYEGDSISAMFLDQRGAVDADLGFYLYQCAY